MRMSFSGVGAAYRPSWGSNSAFFMAEDQLYLMDCGETVFGRMADRPELARCAAVNILVTHRHPDHIGSLGSLASYCRYVLGKPVLVASPDAGLPVILELMGICREAYQFRTDFSEPFPGGIRVTPLKVCHAPGMDCYGYYLSDGKETVFYSGDSNKMPEQVIEGLKAGTLAHVYQETTYEKKENPEHCSLKQLCECIPGGLRGRITCMHFGEEFREAVEKNGFRAARVCEL